jgi:hypothetical protein
MHSSPQHHLHQFGPQSTQNIYHPQQPSTSTSMVQQQVGGAGSGLVSHHPSLSSSNVNISNVDHQLSQHGYSEEFFTPNAEMNELGQSEHYIYVTYPPELKKRLLERYGDDIYFMLMKKDVYDNYYDDF